MTQAHTTTLHTLDCGVPIVRRAWALRDRKSVVSRNTSIQGVRYVTLFVVRCEDVGGTFDTFDDTVPRARLLNALFHLFMRGMEKTTQLLQSKDKAPTLSSVEYPVEMYLEAVLKRPANELPRSAPNYEDLQKRAACENLEKDYGAQRITAEHLMNGARSAAGSSAFGSASTKDIAFMADYDDREVAEYRFWVFSHEESVGPGTSMAAVYTAARDFNTKHFGGGTQQEMDRHRGGGTPAATSVADITGENERWRLLIDEWHYIEAIRHYTNDRTLGDVDVVKSVTGPKVPITDPTNLLFPGTVFSARSYFDEARKSRILDPAQTDMARYFNPRTNTWRFPRSSLVLYVRPERWSVKSMQCMYLPHYQKQCIEPRLDRGTELPLASAVARERANVDDDGDAVEAKARERARDEAAEAAEQEDIDAIESGSDIVLSEDGPQPERVVPPNGGAQLPEEGGAMSDDESSRAMEEFDAEPLAAAAAPPPPLADGEVPRYDDIQSDWNSFICDDLAPTGKMRDFLSNVDVMGGSNKTNIHTLRASYFHTMGWHISGLNDPVKRAFEYTSMQVRSIDEYMIKCTLPSSNISKTGQIINAWVRNAAKSAFGYRFTKTERPYFDKDLSLFGVQMVNEFLAYDRLLFMHTAHSELMLAKMSAMTAYWYAYNQLRLNPLFIGPASTSKSFPLSTLGELMIPGTVTSLTNNSDLAETHDEDDNDNVYIYEEMPHHVLSVKTTKKQVQDQFKDMLTRGAVTRRILAIQPDGGRDARVVTSEKNCAYLMASNIWRSQIEEAVASRTVLREHCLRERSDCTLQSKMSDKRTKAHEPQTKLQIQHFEHNFRIAQSGHFRVEQLITIGTLHEPSAIVLSLVYPRYKSVLQNRFAITVPRRVDEQISVYVRKLVISHQFYWLYHSPMSPYFGAERISVWHLLALNPLLKDSEEIVYFALDQFKESFVNPNQQAVIECLRRYFLPQVLREKRNAREFFKIAPSAQAALTAHITGKNPATTTPTAASAARGGQTRFPRNTDGPTEVREEAAYVIPDNGEGDAEQPHVPMTSDGKEAGDGVVGTQAGQYDFNYFCVKKTLARLAQELQDLMRQNNTSRQLASNDIKNLLSSMTNRKIVTRTFRPNGYGLSPVVVPDELSEELSYPPIRFAVDGTSVYIHSGILFGDDTDPHEVAIRACMTSATPRAKYVSGLPVQDGMPHILNVRNVAPTDYSPLVERLPGVSGGGDGSDGVGGGSLAANGSDRTVGIKISYDEYATRYRLAQLAMPLTKSKVYKYTPAQIELRARKQPNVVAETLIEYPKDLLNSTNQCRDHGRNVARELLHCGLGDMLEKKRKFDEMKSELAFDVIGLDDLSDGSDDELLADAAVLQAERDASAPNQIGHVDRVRADLMRAREAAAAKMRRIGSVGSTPATSTATAQPVVYTMVHNGMHQPPPPPAVPSVSRMRNIAQPILNAESNGPGVAGVDAARVPNVRSHRPIVNDITGDFTRSTSSTINVVDEEEDNEVYREW